MKKFLKEIILYTAVILEEMHTKQVKSKNFQTATHFPDSMLSEIVDNQS